MSDALDVAVQLPSFDRSELLLDVVQEHFDEASFLWCQWAAAQTSLSLGLRAIARTFEKRLFAHLRALAIVAEVAPDVLVQSAPRDAGCAFAAAHGLLALGTADGRTAALELLTKHGDYADDLIWAFDLGRCPKDPHWTRSMATDGRASVRSAAVRGARALALDDVLARLRHDGDPAVVARALSFSVERRLPELVEDIRDLLGARDAALRAEAARAALILQLPEAPAALRDAMADGSATDEMLELYALAADDDGIAALAAALTGSGREAALLFALGASRSREAGDASLPYLDSPTYCLCAAEAIASIAGADPFEHGLVTRTPAAPDAEDGEDRLDVDVPAVLRFWAAARSRPAARALDAKETLRRLDVASARRARGLLTALARESAGARVVPHRAWARDRLAAVHPNN